MICKHPAVRIPFQSAARLSAVLVTSARVTEPNAGSIKRDELKSVVGSDSSSDLSSHVLPQVSELLLLPTDLPDRMSELPVHTPAHLLTDFEPRECAPLEAPVTRQTLPTRETLE